MCYGARWVLTDLLLEDALSNDSYYNSPDNIY